MYAPRLSCCVIPTYMQLITWSTCLHFEPNYQVGLISHGCSHSHIHNGVQWSTGTDTKVIKSAQGQNNCLANYTHLVFSLSSDASLHQSFIRTKIARGLNIFCLYFDYSQSILSFINENCHELGIIIIIRSHSMNKQSQVITGVEARSRPIA